MKGVTEPEFLVAKETMLVTLGTISVTISRPGHTYILHSLIEANLLTKPP